MAANQFESKKMTDLNTVMYVNDKQIIKFNTPPKSGYYYIRDFIKNTHYKIINSNGDYQTITVDNITFYINGQLSLNDNSYEVIKEDFFKNGPNLFFKATKWEKCSSKEKNIIYDMISDLKYPDRIDFFRIVPQMAKYNRINNLISLYEKEFINIIWPILSKSKRLDLIKDSRFRLEIVNTESVSENEAQLMYKLWPDMFKTINKINYFIIMKLSNKQKIKIINKIITEGPNETIPEKAFISEVVKTLSLKYILKIFSSKKSSKYVYTDIFNNIIPNINELQYNKIVSLL